jgi:hypothetical protein
MDRVRAAGGRQKPTAPTTRLMRTYCIIVAFYPTQLGPHSTRESGEALEGLYLDAKPEDNATVELSVSSRGCGLSEVSP